MTMRFWLSLIATCALAACMSAKSSPPQGPNSYFWLPFLGISDDPEMRAVVQEQTDAVLMQRGYAPGGDGIALALGLSDTRDDGSLGIGRYAGGYAYVPAPATPPGLVTIVAYDARTRQPLWRLRAPAPRSSADPDFQTALATALRTPQFRAGAAIASGNGPILPASHVRQADH